MLTELSFYFFPHVPYNGAFNKSWALIGGSAACLPLSLGEMPDKEQSSNIWAERVRVFHLQSSGCQIYNPNISSQRRANILFISR